MDCVYLNSGGLDSAVLASVLRYEYRLHSIFVAHRQESLPKSSVAAEETAKRYCVDHHVITLDMGYDSNYWRGTQTNPDNYHTLSNHTPILLSLGVSHAKLNGYPFVAAAVKAHLPKDYEDTFNKLLEGNFRAGDFKPKIILPLNRYSDGSYDNMLKVLKIPDVTEFSYTYSCRHAEPCGICYKCLLRKDLGV